MTLCTKLAVICMMIFTIVCYHPLPNNIATQILVIVSMVAYVICSRLAEKSEQKLKDRIKALEDKLKYTEERK